MKPDREVAAKRDGCAVLAAPIQVRQIPAKLAIDSAPSYYLLQTEGREQARRGIALEGRRLSLAEVAAYLGVSKESVYRWLELRRMPAHKVGRQWKFKSDEVDAMAGTIDREQPASTEGTRSSDHP